jgi:hypothetical protein
MTAATDADFLDWHVPPRVRQGSRLLVAAAWVVPSLVVMQPLIGGIAATAILWCRSLLLPLWLSASVPRAVNWLVLLLLVALLLATGMQELVDRPDDFLMTCLAVLGAIVLHRGGILAARSERLASAWGGLVVGVTLINVLTIAIYGAVVAGLMDPATLYELLQRDPEFGVSRFSIGNPIEVPFCVSAVLYAALRFTSRSHWHLPAALLNAVVAVISESRIVVLIGVLIFATQWGKSGWFWRSFSAALLVVLLGANWDAIGEVFDSISRRFAGQDYGSGQDRMLLAAAVFSGFGPVNTLVGQGLTSGAELISQVMGTYRTVESMLLQLTYEVGLLGVVLTWLACRTNLPAFRHAPAWRNPIVLLMWIQLLIYLPVSNMTPMAAFALGALAVARCVPAVPATDTDDCGKPGLPPDGRQT